MNIDNFSPGRVKFIKILLPISILIFAYHAISMSFKLNWYYEDPAMLGSGWAAILFWLCLRKWNLIVLNFLVFLPILFFILYTEFTRETTTDEIDQKQSFESYLDSLPSSPTFLFKK